MILEVSTFNCSSQLRIERNDCSFVTSKSNKNPIESLKKAVVKLLNLKTTVSTEQLVKSIIIFERRNLSCPAVS